MRSRSVIQQLLFNLFLLCGLALPMGLAQSTVTILQGVDATTLDPHRIQAAPEANILSHIFETLVARDDDMTIQPRLATAWRIIDPVTWEFDLRQDVRFSDGEAMDAEAVKFSLERAIVADTADIRQLQLNRVEVVDSDTIRIITTNPNPPMLTALLAGWIVSPRHYADLSDEQAAINPVGTGPYTLQEWRRDEAVVLSRNPDYWGGEVPYETLIWRPVPEASTRIAELEVGNAQLVVGVPPEAAARLEEMSGIDVRSSPTGQRFYIGLRHDEEGPLQDSRVRLALNHAVDVPLIIETILGGNGEPRATLLNAPHADTSLEPIAYDPERARELLTEAGYGDGFSMVLQTPNGRYTKDLEIAQAVAAFLRDVGVNVEVVSNEWGRHVDLMLTNELRDAWLLASGAYFDGQLEYNVFMGALEQLTWHNEQAAALWSELQTTVDEADRVAILNDMQRLMLEDPPVIFLHRPIDLYGVSESLDWEPRADGRIALYQPQGNE
jgi:peptide/nickel transport system substrate-binding protein